MPNRHSPSDTSPTEDPNLSPLFPIDNPPTITSATEPLTQTSTLKLYVHLAEPVLYLQGYDAATTASKLPALLRGSLIIRILKPTKVKSISMLLKGTSRTEWPEGIPPKKVETDEEWEFLKHGWGFWSVGDQGYGADLVKALPNDDEEELENINRSSSALNLIRRVGSPSPSRGESGRTPSGRQRSSSILSSLSIPGTSLSSTGNASSNSIPTPIPERDSNGNITLPPGDFHYNFEHPIPCSSPETISCAYGSIRYDLQITIERPGTFKSNIHTTKPLKVVRLQCEDSVEDSEPITISRDWEGQLLYDIVIFSKSIVLDAFIPMSFCLRPTDKIKLHRIRVYLTESIDYYTKNKKIHRSENSKKVLLMEKKAPPPPDLPPDADAKAKKQGNLLTSDGYDLTAREFDFLIYVPRKYNTRSELHPNTFNSQIKIHHWIKICLRLSRVVDGKVKHYEISIDTPIHVMDPLASHANTLLPSYNGLSLFESDCGGTNHKSNTYFPSDVVNSPPISPNDTIVKALNNGASVNGVYNSLHEALNITGSFSNRSEVSLHKPLRYQSDKHPQAEEEYSSSHYLDSELITPICETLESNTYKPENLDMKLTSPQAIPLSPATSPIPQFGLNGFNRAPPSFDEESSPAPSAMSIQATSNLLTPPIGRANASGIGGRSRRGSDSSMLGFTASPLPSSLHGSSAVNIRGQLLSASPVPHHNSIHSDVMSLNSLGSGATIGGFGGIDSIMNNNDVTTSSDNNRNDQESDLRSLVSYRSLSPQPHGYNFNNDQLPQDPPTYDEVLADESRSPLLDDIQSPSTAIPVIDVMRTSESSTPVLSPSFTATMPSNKEEPDEDITSGFQFSGGSSSMPAPFLRSTSPSAQRLRVNQRSRVGSPRGSFEMMRTNNASFGTSLGYDLNTVHQAHQGFGVEEGENEDNFISRVSSTSPRASIDYQQDENSSNQRSNPSIFIDDAIFRTPLLPSSTQISSGINRSSTPSNISLPYTINNDSQDSLDMNRRESYSVDITALYSPTSTRNSHHQRHPSLSAPSSRNIVAGSLEDEQEYETTTRDSDETRQSLNSDGFSSSDTILTSTNTTTFGTTPSVKETPSGPFSNLDLDLGFKFADVETLGAETRENITTDGRA